MNHKRKRPKSTRAGCLLCKGHKRQVTCLAQRRKFSDWKRELRAKDAIAQFVCN